MGSMDGVITATIFSYLIWLRDNSVLHKKKKPVVAVGVDYESHQISAGDVIPHIPHELFEYTKSPNINHTLDSLNFMLYDGVKLKMDDNSFDLITSFMTLHHVKNTEEHISEIHRLLDIGGKWVIREHNVTTPEIKHAVQFQHACYDPGYDNTMTIHQCYSRNKWIQICSSAGFRLEYATPTKLCSAVLRRIGGCNKFVRNPFHSFYMVFCKT
jgi:SAM-dependent methyltransferase